MTADSETLKENVYQALSLWFKGNGAGAPLGDLLAYRQMLESCDSNIRRATNQILLNGLEQLDRSDAQAAAILRMRFTDDQSAQIVANRLNISEGYVFKRQREAIELLTDILLHEETTAQAALRRRFNERLEPPTYTHLFGVADSLARLAENLIQPGPPWFISIEGIGGIGKTSLAHALVHALIADGTVGWRTFVDLAWVTAHRRIFNSGGGLSDVDVPALAPEQLIYDLADQILPDVGNSRLSLKQTSVAVGDQLRAAPHLVVIDNLESLADMTSVLDTVRNWAGPTKFLLTSRRTLAQESALFHHRLAELSETDALALLRHEAHLRNLPALAQADDGALRPIFKTAGGNPLALRLVVGQTLIHSLPDVLEDLAAAQGLAVENLYTYIYRRAWNHLSEEERQTLLLMPLVHENGSDLAYLARIAGCRSSELRPALDRLVGLNLVDSVGSLTERRYTIHNLTRTFLQEQVLHWAR